MKFLLFTFVFLFLVCSAHGQIVLLEQNLKKDTIIRQVGQNLKHYYHAYFDLGFVANKTSNDSLSLNYGLSNRLAFGIRYKRKLCSFYSLGYDLSIAWLTYNIKQSADKKFLDNIKYDNEKFTLYDLSFEAYNRFNYGRRGNIIGKFIDVGGYGTWIFSARHYTKDSFIPAGQHDAQIVERTVRRLNYTERFGYGVSMRAGFNRWVISASYSLANVFKKSANMIEMPKLIVGLQIGFFK